MSTDITGWVEIKKNEHWFGVIKINVLLNRNYAMFDFLFGGRSGNYPEAIAGKRGIPQNRSSEVQSHWGNGNGSEGTWIGWDEIQTIDWTKHETILSDDWKQLFEIMDLLAQKNNEREVRLVVDFF